MFLSEIFKLTDSINVQVGSPSKGGDMMKYSPYYIQTQRQHFDSLFALNLIKGPDHTGKVGVQVSQPTVILQALSRTLLGLPSSSSPPPHYFHHLISPPPHPPPPPPLDTANQDCGFFCGGVTAQFQVHVPRVEDPGIQQMTTCSKVLGLARQRGFLSAILDKHVCEVWIFFSLFCFH